MVQLHGNGGVVSAYHSIDGCPHCIVTGKPIPSHIASYLHLTGMLSSFYIPASCGRICQYSAVTVVQDVSILGCSHTNDLLCTNQDQFVHPAVERDRAPTSTGNNYLHANSNLSPSSRIPDRYMSRPVFTNAALVCF